MVDLKTLLDRCRQGDDLAWEALVRKYQGRVFSVAYQYLRDREEARDAAQDIFIKVYERLGSLQADEAFLPWLLRLSRNCCIDRLRHLKVRTPASSVSVDEAVEVAAAGPTPEEIWRGKGREGLLHQALGVLSEKNREIILLKDIQQLKLEEIARLLALPLGTVKSRSNRARLALAKAVRVLDPSYGA